MAKDLPQAIIIVDRSRLYGISLRASLNKRQVCTHVFHNFAAALALLRSKKIDTVVVEFDGKPETAKFCEEARARDVPVVFSASPVKPKDLRQNGFHAEFQDVPGRPRMFVHYRKKAKETA